MWTWFFSAYAVLFAVVILAAAAVALLVPDPKHRADGFRVLKFVLSTAAGSGGLIAVALKLHEAGLL